MSWSTEVREERVAGCDWCGEVGGDLHSYKFIICYGWRRDSNHRLGVPEENHIHDSCIGELLSESLALSEAAASNPNPTPNGETERVE